MAATHHQIIGSGRSFAVYRGALRVSGFVTHYDLAAARANALDKITLPTLRACLCCTKNFKSTGRHHRLCDTCRQAA